MIKTDKINNYTIYDYPGNDMEQLSDIWRLLERGADMTAFQSFDWHYNLWQKNRFETIKNLFRVFRYILVSRDDKPLLIAPLEVQRIGIGYRAYGAARGVYFAGRRGYTDYLNMVYENFDPDALEAVLDYVTKAYWQHRFSLERMLESSASYRYLSGHYSGVSEPVRCAALVIPESFGEYQKNLSKSSRQNIRTAINRARKNGIILTHELLHDEGEEVKKEIIALNQQRLKKKNNASRQQMSFAGRIYCSVSTVFGKLFSAKQDVVRESKNTFCFLVKENDQLAGFFWGIRNDYLREYYVILAGVNEKYEWYSPNISHLYLFLEEYFLNAGDTIRLVDFTRGAEGYKKTIGCTDRPVYSYHFMR